MWILPQEEFEAKMNSYKTNLRKLFEKSNDLEKEIKNAVGKSGI